MANQIKILPRESLTKKARAAIYTYALAKSKGCYIAAVLIRFTLEAERMARADLYSWLQNHGFKWDSIGGLWRKEEKQNQKIKKQAAENIK